MSWLFPDDARRLGRLTFMFGGLVRDMLPDAGVVHLADDASAALLASTRLRARAHRRRPGRSGGRRRPHPFTPDELERLGILGATMMAETTPTSRTGTSTW